MNDTKFLIIVVTYNRLELLKECIACIRSQIYLKHELLVVDNYSTDGTREFLNEKLKDGERFISLGENLGGAGGFHAGLAETMDSDYDWCVLIDDDAMLMPSFLSVIKKAIYQYPDIACFSGTVLTKGKIDLSQRLLLKSKLFSLFPAVPLEQYGENSFEYDFTSFCGVVIKHDLIRIIGLPIKEYFIWYDDIEYSCRIRKFSKIKNINSAIIDHKRSDFVANHANWRLYYGVRNRFDMVKKHMGNTSLFILYIRTSLIILYHSFFIMIDSDREERRFIRDCYLHGLLDARKDKLGRNSYFSPNR